MSAKRRDKPVRVNTYLPEALVTRIDEYVEKLTATDPYKRPVTRTDAIRLLVTEALDRTGTNE